MTLWYEDQRMRQQVREKMEEGFCACGRAVQACLI
jgi:hypothetical protein